MVGDSKEDWKGGVLGVSMVLVLLNTICLVTTSTNRPRELSKGRFVLPVLLMERPSSP